MGAVKTSRDSEYQAIMPIRGKILNCLKADYAASLNRMSSWISSR